MKKIFIFAISFFCVYILTACTGFNAIMYRHLSNKENYKTYEVEIDQIYVYDKETRKREIYDRTIHDESYLSEAVSFGVLQIDGNFDGGEYALENGELTDYTILFEITSDNSQELINSGFYNVFSVGDTVKITASDWIYMDTSFYYIIGVEYQGTQYLISQDGLKNIINMMDNDRSLF